LKEGYKSSQLSSDRKKADEKGGRPSQGRGKRKEVEKELKKT